MLILIRYGIKITSISSDGDARLLTCMKHSLNAMIDQLSSDVINNLSREQSISFIQDPIHLATKLRNRLQKPSILLPMGTKQVSVSHLKILINSVKKEIHGLFETDICPEDKQNFGSFEKVTQDRVLNALKSYVMDSEGTIQYLRLSKNLTCAFTDVSLNPLERVHMLWHALYFFRAWRRWIQKDSVHHNENSFISSNAFSCLELNAYGLIHLISKFRDAGQSDLFLPAIFSSQHCESTFRQFRSMTTANWTKINFTMHELLHTINRIEMQNEIAYFKLPDLAILPRIHKKTEKHPMVDLPTNEQLRTVMESALDTALQDAEKFGMILSADEIRFCQLSKGNIWDYQTPKDTDALDNTDKTSEDEIATMDCTYFRDYSGTISDFDGNSRFVHVLDKDGTDRIIRKGSVVWRATSATKNLSNDRLKRVQGWKNEVDEPPKSLKRRCPLLQNTDVKKIASNSKNDLIILDNIRIGDWCLLKKNGYSPPKNFEIHFEGIVVGRVLGFKYVSGATEKDKQYSLDTAPISTSTSNKRGIEVLASWYGLNDDLTLSILKNPSFFISIDNYIAHSNHSAIILNQGNTCKISGNILEIKKTLLGLLF